MTSFFFTSFSIVIEKHFQHSFRGLLCGIIVFHKHTNTYKINPEHIFQCIYVCKWKFWSE